MWGSSRLAQKHLNSSNIKPMLEHSEANKWFKPIAIGNMD